MGRVGRAIARIVAFAALTIVTSAVAPQGVAAKPARIVSLNICLDQLVVRLADRRNIASISFLGADPGFSDVADRVGDIPQNHGLAEEILPLDPDLVLAGKYGAREAVALLRRLGYRVVEIESVTRLSDIPGLIRRVAALVGEPARGDKVAATLSERLARHRVRATANRPLAAIYNPNGYTPGIGSLENAVVEAAGFESLGRRLEISGTAVIPLELLLVNRPDVLITGRGHLNAPSLATELLNHPVLRRVFDRARTVRVPDRLWICAGPSVVDAIDRLVAVRRAIRQGDP